MFSFLKKESGIEVKAPVNGEIFPIESVNDPVFSEKNDGRWDCYKVCRRRCCGTCHR